MADNPKGLIIEYRTADQRFGLRYGVANAHDALAAHPDAVIVGYEDGTPFEGKDARAEVREARADIREERAAEREQAATEPEPMPAVEPTPAPVSATDAPPVEKPRKA